MNLKYTSVQDYDKCLKERTELGGGGGGGCGGGLGGWPLLNKVLYGKAPSPPREVKQFLSDLLGV